MRAAYSSYFVTTYKRNRCTWSKRNMNKEKDKRKKRKKTNQFK